MVLLELVCQGVKGLPPAVRLALTPGYTLLLSQKVGASLWGLIDALCYADGRSTDATQLRDPAASMARVGLTFTGRDGQTYRLVRELGGSGTLAQLEAGTGKFLALTQDATEIAQYLRATVGIPTRGTYQQIFSLAGSQWPSKQPARASSGPGPAKPSAGLQPSSLAPALNPSSYAAVQPSKDLPAARALIAQLTLELEKTREVEALQFRLDGLQKRVFDQGAQLRQADALRGEVTQAQAALESAPSPESLGLPANVVERAGLMEAQEKQRDEQLLRLEREREQLAGRALAVRPLSGEPLFWAGLGVGAASVALALVLGHGWRYLALLDIPAFGMAALMALRWVGDLQASRSTARRQDHYAEKEKQIRDAFENEVLSVRTAMKVLKVGSPGELVELLGRRTGLEQRLGEARDRLLALESDPAFADVQQELSGVQAEQAEVEARVSELSSYTRQTHSIQGEIEDLEASIAAALEPPPAAEPAEPSAASAASPASDTSAPTAQAPAAQDPCPALLDAVTELFQLDLQKLGQLLAPRCGQYLGALSDRRLSAIELNHLGQAQITTAEGKRGAGQLPPADRDLVYLAVKLTLMEKYAEREKLPFLFDAPFAGLDATKVALIGRMLKHLGTRAQVLHLTSSAVTQPLADASFTL